jgi:hypothetical protein
MQAPVTFYLNNLPVGYFSDDSTPIADGDYKYMPYRGPGHYNLGLLLKSSQVPRCHYTSSGRRIEFSVLAQIEYGVLRLSGFESTKGDL